MGNFDKMKRYPLRRSVGVCVLGLVGLFSPLSVLAEQDVTIADLLSRNKGATTLRENQANLEKNVVSIEAKGISFLDFFTLLKEKSGQNIFLSYVVDDIKAIGNVTVSEKNSTVATILKKVLSPAGLVYVVQGNIVSIKKAEQPSQSAQQKVSVKGKVINLSTGKPVPGATVLIQGTQIGAIADANGDFILQTNQKTGILEVTCVGYIGQKVNYTAGTPLQLKMKPDVMKVEDVTVVAYGQRKTREVVGAISSVKGAEIKEMPTHSLESLLQGRMAGVEINNISGSPGGGGSVVAIRGYNSMFVEGEGQDREYGTPLYVVDGVPIHSFTSPVTGANTLSNIDPANIESIEVLKDAASAAIYGSRASNGVILITTKKGRSGPATFSANVSTSFSYLPKTPVQTGGNGERKYYLQSLRNTFSAYKDWETGEYKIPSSYKEAFQKGGIYDYFTDKSGAALPVLQDSLNEFYNNSTDWFRYAYQVAKVYNANIQTSGGNENIQYMIGAGYFNEEGIMRNSSFSRASFLANLNVHPTKRLFVDSQISLAYSDRSRGGERRGVKVEGVTVDPTYESSLRPGDSFVKEKILEDLNNVAEKNYSYNVLGNLVLRYQIVDGLELSVAGSVDFNQQNLNLFTPSSMDRVNQHSTSKGSITRSISMLNENILKYKFKIADKHNFDLIAGVSLTRNQDMENSGNGNGGPNDYIHYVGDGWGNGFGFVNVGQGMVQPAFKYRSDYSEDVLNSFFGRIAYNYQSKYLTEFTLRRDGSSKFGENVRWATFPSVAAGWAFTEEKFMKSLYWFNFGKIRASWGTSGQTFSQRYLAYGLYTPSLGSVNGSTGMMPGTAGGMINRDLTWEETDQYDVGLDVDMFNYRFKMKFDYYRRYTKAQLSRVSLPGNMYYHNMQWRNAMETSNSGIEFETQIEILRESSVQWRARFNISRNWNKFEKSYDGEDTGSLVIGKPLNQILVYKDQGYYEKLTDVPVYYSSDGSPKPLYEGSNESYIFLPGERRVADLNGDGEINDKDMYYAATSLPLAHGGITSELRWKNFDLNVLFNFSIGRNIIKIYDDIKLNASSPGNALLVDLGKLDSWTNSNQNADYPFHMAHGEVGHSRSQYSGLFESGIEKVNFLRLKQLTIGYNLGQKALKTIGLKSLRFFVTCENLFLLTNYSGLDPEIVSIYDGIDNLRSYPLPRKFTLGITANF